MKLRAILLAASLFIVAPPAYADHEYDYDYGNEDSNKKCNGARDNCSDNDFSPTFDKSPVDIHGNQICVMPGSCSPSERGPEQEK